MIYTFWLKQELDGVRWLAFDCFPLAPVPANLWPLDVTQADADWGVLGCFVP